MSSHDNQSKVNIHNQIWSFYTKYGGSAVKSALIMRDTHNCPARYANDEGLPAMTVRIAIITVQLQLKGPGFNAETN